MIRSSSIIRSCVLLQSVDPRLILSYPASFQSLVPDHPHHELDHLVSTEVLASLFQACHYTKGFLLLLITSILMLNPLI